MRLVRAAAHRLRDSFRVPRRLRSWNPISIIVLGGYAAMIMLNISYGFLPVRYSFKQEKFVVSKPLGIYCLVAATAFGFFYVRDIWEELSTGQIDQRDSIKIYCYMNACGGLLFYLYQWSITMKNVNWLNTTTVFGDINYFDVTVLSMMRHMALVLLKIFGFPLVMQLTLVSYNNSWLKTTQTMLPILSSSQLNNCFIASVVIAKAIFKQINVLLVRILVEVNRLQTPSEMLLHKPFYRMQRFCDLADRLDELGRKYVLACYYSIGWMEFGCFSLVISMAINLFSTTLGCYVQYQAFVDYLLLEIPFDWTRNLAQFVFLALPFLEIVLLARETQQCLDEAREVGNLLQRMNLEHADVRFKQEVDLFWLEVSSIKFKLMPLGLLVLDGSMINKLYTTVTGFLLFLIQNDLTVRFSLK